MHRLSVSQLVCDDISLRAPWPVDVPVCALVRRDALRGATAPRIGVPPAWWPLVDLASQHLHRVTAADRIRAAVFVLAEMVSAGWSFGALQDLASDADGRFGALVRATLPSLPEFE